MDKNSIDSPNYNFVKEESEGFGRWLGENTFLAETSRENYVSCVKTFLKRHGEFNDENCRKYLKTRPRKYVVSALKHYSEYRGQGVVLPKIKEPPRSKQVDLSMDEVKGLIDTLRDGLERISADSDTIKDMVLVCELRVWTSMRIREALRVRVGDINLKDNKVIFRKKGGDFGENYLPPEFAARLYNYATEKKGLGAAEEIFFSETKSGRDLAGAKYRLFRYHLKRAIPDNDRRKLLEKTHIIRRSVINAVGEKSNDIFLASRIANHKCINTTAGYFGDRIKDLAARRALETMEGEYGKN